MKQDLLMGGGGGKGTITGKRSILHSLITDGVILLMNDSEDHRTGGVTKKTATSGIYTQVVTGGVYSPNPCVIVLYFHQPLMLTGQWGLHCVTQGSRSIPTKDSWALCSDPGETAFTAHGIMHMLLISSWGSVFSSVKWGDHVFVRDE